MTLVAKSRTAPVYAALTSSFRDPQTPIRGVVDEVSLDLIAVNHRDPGTKRQISRIAKNRRFGSLRNRNEEFFPQLLQPVHRQWTATQTTQAEESVWQLQFAASNCVKHTGALQYIVVATYKN